MLSTLYGKWRSMDALTRRVALFSGGTALVYYLLLRAGRSKPTQKLLTDSAQQHKQVGVNKAFVGQLGKLLPTLFPSFFCKEVVLVAAHTSCLVARTLASIYLANMDGKIARALVSAEGKKFVGLLGVWLLSTIPIAFVNAAIKFLKNQIALSFRARLTKKAHEEYMKGLTYYQLDSLDGRLPNADQCITSDVAKFASSLADLYSNLAKPALDVAIYNVQLATNVGPIGLGSVTLLIHTGTLALRLFTPPFGVLTAEHQALEGEFRFFHSRVTTNAEEIAFYGGANIEKTYLDRAFEHLKRHSHKLYLAQLQFGSLEQYITKYFWGALGFLICALPVFTPFGEGMRGAKSDNLADRTQAFFTNRRILLNTSDAFGRLLTSWRKVNELSGYTARVSNMFTIFEDMAQGRFHRTFRPNDPNAKEIEPFVSHGKVLPSNGQISVEGLDLINPTGDLLAQNMNFEIVPGKNVLISGPNGCGKSSLFRVIGSLWPIVKGTILKPLDQGAIFYIPQRPYLSMGTLRDQIIYPSSLEDVRRKNVTDQHLEQVLDMVHLKYLLDSYGGFDAVKNWKDCLSGGEKQRVALARLFFHKPKFAILDECTSAVSIDVESAIYKQAKDLGITLITVSHRHSLWKFHEFLLTMNGKGQWSFGSMEAQQGALNTANSVQKLTLLQEKEEISKRLKEIDGLLEKDNEK